MDAKRRRVLVVDSSHAWRRDLSRGLSQQGVSVSLAATLREGRHLAKREDVDAIVLDVLFPDGYGLRFLPELRCIRPDAALLLCTAHASIAAAVAAIRAGAHDFLVKPITPEHVAASIGHALAALQGGAPPTRSPILATSMSLDRVQWEHLHRILMECDWNISEAARRLGIHRQSLQRKLRQPPGSALS